MALRPTALASPVKAPSVGAPSSALQRDVGLDALRATMTLLVLFHHTAITYGAAGGWFYHEVAPGTAPGTKLLSFFCGINQAYFMGLFFLLAGYFTPSSYARHGAWTYAKERMLRLGVPWLFFGFVLGPATMALAQTAKGEPFLESLAKLWSAGTFANGPLWFAEALLIFSFAFMAWKGLASRLITKPLAAPSPAFPSNLVIGLSALITGAAAFALRLVWPVGTQAWGLQLGYFASYIVLFAAGCLAASGHRLRDLPQGQTRGWLIVSLLTLPVLPLVVAITAHVPALQGKGVGGWNIAAAVYAFWEPFVAWGLIMALVRTFQRRFTKLSPTWKALTRRAYTIYIIHPPVLVAIALLWRDVPATPLIKFVVTGIATCLACFSIAGLLLRSPALSRIL